MVEWRIGLAGLRSAAFREVLAMNPDTTRRDFLRGGAAAGILAAGAASTARGAC